MIQIYLYNSSFNSKIYFTFYGSIGAQSLAFGGAIRAGMHSDKRMVGREGCDTPFSTRRY